MHVWDEFSEFLLENRVPTSADTNFFYKNGQLFVFQNMFMAVVSYPMQIQKCNVCLLICHDKPVIPYYSHFFPRRYF